MAVVAPAAMPTILPLPSLPAATKSAFGASATVRFTVRLALGALLAVTVKVAIVPSVTGEGPAAMLTSGVAARVLNSTSASLSPAAQPLAEYTAQV